MRNKTSIPLNVLKINAALFDLDGTLLDRDRSLRAFAQAQYDRFSRHLEPLSRDQFVSRLMALDENGRVWKDEVYRRLLSEAGITGLAWQDLLKDYEQGFRHCCHGFPGLEEMVAALKAEGLRLGLISNGRSPFQEQTFEALGIAEAFDSVVVSEAAGARKPDRRIFELAMDRLKVTARESVFIGDNPEADIAGARAAGLRAIWMRNRHWPECLQASQVCDNLAEIPAAIVRLGP